jgi:hypothetical protein
VDLRTWRLEWRLGCVIVSIQRNGSAHGSAESNDSVPHSKPLQYTIDPPVVPPIPLGVRA